MSINWYPGHMAKSRRLMAGDLKNIDAVCEVIDARIPRSSRNPELDRLCRDKRRIIVLNRADQADPAVTAQWEDYYQKRGFTVIATDSEKGGFGKAFEGAVKKCCADLIARNEAKGQVGRMMRLMIVGIPNVGKSSFINRLLGKKAAVAADKPGVTRGAQWYSLPGAFDFMDTPGLLWPKIESDEVGYNLAFTGTIRDEILDLEDLACRFINVLRNSYADILVKRFNITVSDDEIDYDILQKIAFARSLVLRGNEPDTERAAKMLLTEFRSGKLGRITLETPNKR
ncbi:MAG: ribosome biogenesis GTPase YlqF [Clostridia bacterium]|nr:ribosome biogenesis GTPase YlqF [Clostridia bacterium]